MEKVMYPITALWTYPRTISTAFERIMIERGDFHVFHEPFSYLYYVHENKTDNSQEYIDTSHPSTFPEICDMLINKSQKQPVFFKDMALHCINYLLKDNLLIQNITHTFLIRDPAKTIASNYAMDPNISLDGIGCHQLYDLYQKTIEVCNSQPVIIDADDLENNPGKTVSSYCQAIDIMFIEEAMRWEASLPEEWKIWESWHKDAARTTSIQKNIETFEHTVENHPKLKSYYEYHQPVYIKMHEKRIQ